MNGSGGSSTSTTPNFDNLLLQSLMSRLQLRSPNNNPNPIPNHKSLEQLLFSDLLLNLSESDIDDDDDDDDDHSYDDIAGSYSSKTHLAKEEARLEKDIVRTILKGDIETLKPNSGQAVTIGEHHICVGFHEETGSEYRVWEWHGHIMSFDEENGYTPEYIYGNYFERVDAAKREMMKKKKKAEEEKKKKDDDDDKEDEEEVVGSSGLKELIGVAEPGSGHILHRNINANSGSPRF